jgi:hypothetical protein
MQVIFVAIAHEIYPTFIRTIPLLWHVEILAKLKATLSDTMPKSMRWLNFTLVNSTWLNAVMRSENYQHHTE